MQKSRTLFFIKLHNAIFKILVSQMTKKLEPKIGKFPIEIFGTVYTDNSVMSVKNREEQFCPYIQRECTKPRKSEPHIKVGICSVGYKGSFLKENTPSIICPHRFLEPNLFPDITRFFYPEWSDTKVSSEVSMGSGGNVDYVIHVIKNNEVEDFLCVEIQANGTTGSPYEYVRELIEDNKYSGKTYTYGLNWANEFSKTMMQQAFKKGKIVTLWNKKIVFVIQDVAMQYLKENVDTSALRKNKDDHIHFLMLKMVWNEKDEKFDLVIDSWLSTDIDGISKLLGGAIEDEYPTQEEFIKVIKRRLIS